MSNIEDAAVIDPRRGRRETPLPPVAVMAITPLDLEFFIHCFPVPPKRSHKIFLADVYTGLVEGVPVAVVGPVLGAPQAVMVLEKLVALGVERLVAVGWCGSLQPHVKIGDVVVPMGSFSEEGTSTHYPIEEPLPGPSSELLDVLLESIKPLGLTLHKGMIWTTDAPFRETASKVIGFRERGALAVEMEASALFTVSRFRKVDTALMLVVSDELSSLKWVHGFRENRFVETRQILIRSTLNVVCSTIRQMA
jgi:uridine phosphorylase